ncbi:hypothetical protein GTS_29370 [Gandjariella thermophila]|uniref:Uncharacterized protein n=1 Tax=Gandjariella thermophila TaxID=1931992 RepID=A0A4D4J730_9PSEU|nr:hypothetical protein GTS_29370 [Gandjariella thermophila]
MNENNTAHAAATDPKPHVPVASTAKKRKPATRPGYRPVMRPNDGKDRLSEALEALRNEESW